MKPEESMLSGKILVMHRYDRNTIRSMPDALFVFGDNMARVGYGGQAAAARGEPNSVGIPTKMHPSVYLFDKDFYDAKKPIVQAFVILARHLTQGKDIVWPADGVGTGLARLPETAPQIFAAIERCKQGLFSMAKEVIVYH